MRSGAQARKWVEDASLVTKNSGDKERETETQRQRETKVDSKGGVDTTPQAT